MRRIVEPSRIVYLERHWKLSLLMFLMSVGTVGLSLIMDPPSSQGESLGGFLVYAAGFLLGALWLQHQSRAFIVDSAAGLLVILERRFLRCTQRTELPLEGIRVATTSALERGLFQEEIRRTWIWIETRGRPRVLFRGYLQDPSVVHDTVLGLRQDLEAPGPSGSGLGPHQHA